MQNETHLSEEALARWLTGRMEHDEMLATVAPHFFAQCATCNERRAELERLKNEIGHWDEFIAVVETRDAPEQLTSLLEVPFEEQLHRLAEDEALHTWGLCQQLLSKSREALLSRPARAVDLATLAVNVAASLDDSYDATWVLDLRARAFAELGNARRVLGELRAADDDFRQAEALFAQSTTGNPLVEATIADLKSSLRRDQRRLPEAFALVDRALSLNREAGSNSGVWKLTIQKAKILEETGDYETALSLLEALPREMSQAEEPHLYRLSRHNLVVLLNLSGRSDKAYRQFEEVKELFKDSGEPLDHIRLRWLGGLIALGLDWFDEADEALREVQQEYLKREMGYDAALVSLDLGLLYAKQNRTDDLKRLAIEILPVFESRDVHREAFIVLFMFQYACEEARLTVDLARQLAILLRRERVGRVGV